MVTRAYQCTACDGIHDRYTDAEECCQPDVIDVWQCDKCGEDYESEHDAAGCCAGIPDSNNRCPVCHREYNHPRELNRTCIEVAGHCQTCNPRFSYDEQFDIEDLHFQRHERWERVNA